MKTINEILKQARKNAGLSVAQMSKLLGVIPSRIYHIETPGRNISWNTIQRYAKALNIKIKVECE